MNELWEKKTQEQEKDAGNGTGGKALDPDSEEFFPVLQTGGLKRTPVKIGQKTEEGMIGREDPGMTQTMTLDDEIDEGKSPKGTSVVSSGGTPVATPGGTPVAATVGTPVSPAEAPKTPNSELEISEDSLTLAYLLANQTQTTEQTQSPQQDVEEKEGSREETKVWERQRLVQDVAREVTQVLEAWRKAITKSKEEKWDDRMADFEQMIRKERAEERRTSSEENCRHCRKEKLEAEDKDTEIALLRREAERLQIENRKLTQYLENKDYQIEQLGERMKDVKMRHERLKEWIRADKCGEPRQTTDNREMIDTGEASGIQAIEEKIRKDAQNTMDARGEVKDGSEKHGTNPEAKLVTLAHVASATGGLGAMAANGGRHGDSQPNDPEPKGLNEEELEQEKKARRERKKKIIIKGLTLLRAGERKKEMEQWLKETLETEVRVDKLERVGGAIWRAELESLGQKLDIMDRKGRLEALGWGVWITDDLTERQREVQTWLGKQADGWKMKGYETTVGYQRLWVDGACLEWDELKGELVQSKIMKVRTVRESRAPTPPLIPAPFLPFRGRGRGRLQGWGAGSDALERTWNREH